MNPDQKEAMREQSRNRIGEQSQAAAVKAQIQDEQKRIKNPEFLKQLQDPDVDSDLWDWVEDEVGPPLSGSHILGVRDPSYERRQMLLNKNKTERLVSERSPGRLLRENPRMLAQAQGIEATEQYPDPTNNPQFRKPLTARKKRVLRASEEVMTNRQSLSIEGRGVDAVSTATVESRTLSNEETEQKGIRGKAKRVFE